MTTRQPTRRRDIENALGYLEALQMELKDGLTSKGFVAHIYLEEKWNWLQFDMKKILASTGTVEKEKAKA